MMLTQNQKLYIAQFFRVAVTVFILYGLDISLFYKIIFIMLSDLLDRDIPNIFFYNWISGTSNTYQYVDKITDSICYLILLIFLINACIPPDPPRPLNDPLRELEPEPDEELPEPCFLGVREERFLSCNC